MEELTLLLCGSTNSMHFVAITETWLNDSYNDAWTSISGFSCERRDRNSSQRGGGIVVYLNENFCIVEGWIMNLSPLIWNVYGSN